MDKTTNFTFYKSFSRAVFHLRYPHQISGYILKLNIRHESKYKIDPLVYIIYFISGRKFCNSTKLEAKSKLKKSKLYQLDNK